MHRAALIVPLAVLAAAAGCDRARPIVDAASGAAACTGCHGDASRVEDVALVQAAPPVTVDGGADGGAHLAHLHPSAFAPAVACDACHVVPRTVSHSDGVVSVPFPSLARPDGLVPAWDPATRTCSGVYCHGAALADGATASPPWSSTAALGCSSCHGYPPASHAGRSSDCSTCHPGTVKADGTIWVENGLHVNGQIDGANVHAADWTLPSQHGYTVNRTGLASCKTCHGSTLAGGSGPGCASCHDATVPGWDTSCTFCHGNRSTGRASPPVDTQGGSSTANVSVGVHASHVGTTIATPLACTECHPARTGSVITDAAHIDGDGHAEVVFGALARTGGAGATYARASATSATCSSVYCHGQFTGGSGWDPSWTSTAAATCTSCHGNPPGTGHHGTHSSFACSECHGHSGSGATHVNGTKDVPMPGISGALYNTSTRSCGTFTCHGDGHGSSRTW